LATTSGYAFTAGITKMSDHNAALTVWFRDQIVDSEVEVDLDRVFPVGPDPDQPNETAFVQSMTAYFVRVRLSEATRPDAVDLSLQLPGTMEQDRTLGGRLASATARVEHVDWNAEDAPGRLTFRIIVTQL